jgi:DNA-directed RNA polymerase subunit M/transcription elongation factor TFIIS
MSNNYPPGVTGHEPQIAGSDEHEVQCGRCSNAVTAYGTFQRGHRDGAYAEMDYTCESCGHVGSTEVWLEPDEDEGSER